jgi:hypothetical protein
MSNPTTIAIACLLDSEAGIVPRRDDDAGHAIYQVTLDGLGTAAATQHSKVSDKRHSENRVSRRRPSLRHQPDATTTPRMTLSAGIHPER